jgi:hypothetical protein
MTDLDAEKRKLGGDFQKRQARLLDALHRRATTAAGFAEIEKFVGVHFAPTPPPTLDARQLFTKRYGPDGKLVTKAPRRP